MARWRLTQPHYLNVEGTKYRYEETDRNSGETAVQEYPVPRLLDPKNPKDCRSAGDCIVAYKGSEQRGDWIFTGDPTPDMDPVDDEAGKITEAVKINWTHPMDDMPDGGYGQSLLEGLEKKLTEAFRNAGQTVGNQSLSGVSPEDFKALQEQVAALMAQNAELKAAKPEARR